MTPELLGEYILTVGGCIIVLGLIVIFCISNLMD
jgi:hypothetical protein